LIASTTALPWLSRGSDCGEIRAKIATGILTALAYQSPHNNKKRGGVVNNQIVNFPVASDREEELAADERGFTTEDILWALGIWSVILCLSPVIVFYMLMVA